jgi:hypothetical protein
VKAFVEFLLEVFPSPAPWDLIISQAEQAAADEVQIAGG